MDKWAVLGASSFSGRAFCAHLRGHDQKVLEISRPRFELNSNVPSIVSAMREFAPDYFVNFAALNMVGESWRHSQDYYRTNVVALSKLYEALANRINIRRFVQVSTPEVYGLLAGIGPMREHSRYAPSTPYAVSRAALDMHLMAMHRVYGLPVSFIRTVNVYGEQQQPYRIIPKATLKILREEKLTLDGGGLSTRSFIHISDVAEAIRVIATKG